MSSAFPFIFFLHPINASCELVDAFLEEVTKGSSFLEINRLPQNYRLIREAETGNYRGGVYRDVADENGGGTCFIGLAVGTLVLVQKRIMALVLSCLEAQSVRS